MSDTNGTTVQRYTQPLKPKHPGNPLGGKRERLRGAFLGEIKNADMHALARETYNLAMAGDRYARRDLLEYCLGKPEQTVTLANSEAIFQSDDSKASLLEILNRVSDSNGICQDRISQHIPDPPAHPPSGEDLPSDTSGTAPPTVSG